MRRPKSPLRAIYESLSAAQKSMQEGKTSPKCETRFSEAGLGRLPSDTSKFSRTPRSIYLFNEKSILASSVGIKGQVLLEAEI
jgi:hypothetical protein